MSESKPNPDDVNLLLFGPSDAVMADLRMRMVHAPDLHDGSEQMPADADDPWGRPNSPGNPNLQEDLLFSDMAQVPRCPADRVKVIQGYLLSLKLDPLSSRLRVLSDEIRCIADVPPLRRINR